MPANLKSRAEYFLIGVRGSAIQPSDSLAEMFGLPASPFRPTETVVESLVNLLALLCEVKVYWKSE